MTHAFLPGSVRKLNTSSSISCHDIACCGVAFSDGGEGLCAGDLAGGVWAMEENTAYSIHKTSVSSVCFWCRLF